MEAKGAVNCYFESPTVGMKIPHTLRKIWTMNLTNGVTPFVLIVNKVEYCSEMYRLRGEGIVIGQVWYRPTGEQFRDLHPSVQDHVLNGGLLHTDDFGVKSFVSQVPDDFEAFQQICQTTYGRRLATTPGG